MTKYQAEEFRLALAYTKFEERARQMRQVWRIDWRMPYAS
jgi:hypothetical protein